MINHIRTLLLNQHPDTAGPTDIGYEYVPAAFKPVALPTALETVHKILFGSRPDNYFRNFRVREMLGYIHQTELDVFARKFDNRVTYWPQTQNPFYGAAKQVFVEQIAGQPKRLNIAGTLFAGNAVGRAEYEYILILGKKNTGSPAEQGVFVVRADDGKTTTETFTTAAPTISLPETQLKTRIDSITGFDRLTTEVGDIFIVEDYSQPGGEILLERPAGMNILAITQADELIDSVTAAWRVSARANPSPAILTVLPNLEFLGEPLYLELFGVKPAEPYATFLNLWENHPLPAYRLSSIVLALVYRLNELLRG